MSTSTIKVQNIYYLLCYAWDKLEEKEIVNVNEDGITHLLDLFARVLINGTSHLFRQGLDRSYIERKENIRGIRGKLDLSQSVKSGLFQKQQTHCAFDEFDYNVLHNQILKTTIRKLIQIEAIDKKLKGNLYSLYTRFGDIDEIEITPWIFSRVKLNRNNQFYDFLLKICETIYTNLFFNEEKGNWEFKEFLQDEKKMQYLFQNFVKNFYRIELGCSINKGGIEWALTSNSKDAKNYLPRMIMDITMKYKGRNIIIDTKYYKKTLNFTGKKKSIHSNHLYQLFAYVKNVEARDKIDNLEGILIYPVVTDNFKFEYNIHMSNHKMSIYTINLNQHHSLIGSDLKKIIESN